MYVKETEKTSRQFFIVGSGRFHRFSGINSVHFGHKDKEQRTQYFEPGGMGDIILSTSVIIIVCAACTLWLAKKNAAN